MTKEQTLKKLAAECFNFEEGFGDISRRIVQVALEAAYEAGAVAGLAAQLPQAAPAEPRSKLIYVEETKDTLEIFSALQGQIEVRVAMDWPRVCDTLHIPVQHKDDLDWLYIRCCTWRLATFRKLGEHLVKM